MSDADAANKKFQKELNAGTVSLVLLSVLNLSAKPMYGYQIAKQIVSSGKNVHMMKQGALYPVLRSLEKNGFLKSKVAPSISGPPRRYYSITKEGKKKLKEWGNIWREMKGFVDDILRGKGDA